MGPVSDMCLECGYAEPGLDFRVISAMALATIVALVMFIAEERGVPQFWCIGIAAAMAISWLFGYLAVQTRSKK